MIVSVQQPSEQIVPKSTTFLPATQLPIEHSSVQEPVRSSVNVQCYTSYGPVYSNEARTYVPSVKMEPPRQQLLTQPSLVQIHGIQSSLLPSEQQTRTRHPVSQTLMQPYSHQSSVHLIPQPQNMPFYSAQPSVYAHQTCHLPNFQQPVHMHAPPVPLQPSRIEHPNNPQQFLVQQRPEPYYVQPRSQPTQQTYMSEMTKFLVKKDILKLRLSKFMDIPGTFVSWKTTFQSVLR